MSGVVAAVVGGVVGSVAAHVFTKRLNRTNIALELIKLFMAQYLEGAQLEKMLRQRSRGGKSLSPDELELIFKFGGWYEVISRAYLDRTADPSLLDSMNIRVVLARFLTLVKMFESSYSELARTIHHWKHLAQFTRGLGAEVD
jgi:hypothetical protein